MTVPLMPKATAVWLIENTTLSFEQIAGFCGMHPLEVQGIADGEVAEGITGASPIASGQLTKEELEKSEKDPNRPLHIQDSFRKHLEKKQKGGRYTPVARRHDKPDAIAWFIKYHSEVSDAQVIKLIGTTKHTIASVRDKTHWNSSNIKPKDPVLLGLCTQVDLDNTVAKAKVTHSAQKSASA